MRCARRDFLRGDWRTAGGSAASGSAPSGSAEIASILVQAWPERLDEAAGAITAIAGAEIYSRDARGKLVVVVEAPDAGTVGTTLNHIAAMPSVLSATLVFHATDAAQSGG
jgi:periplasmic nitrate reductase NapD